MVRYSILITTRNRAQELAKTLSALRDILGRTDVECLVWDDGSTDETQQVLARFPNLTVIGQDLARGYLVARNRLLSMARGKYAISLDDDAQFLSGNPLAEIESHFEKHAQCGAIAFRIFWGGAPPESEETDEVSHVVKGFVGCGHAWRMEAWNQIPDYPEWFGFYGEEEVAAMDLFANGWQVWYVPSILVWHRVDLAARARATGDWALRQRRSLRSGWYRYGLLLPWGIGARYWSGSLWAQFRKIAKGETRLALPVLMATLDLLRHIPRIGRERRALSGEKFRRYAALPETRIFWRPGQR